MKRVATGLIGLIACAAALVGCSDDKGSEPAPASSPTTAAAGDSEVTTGGGATEIKVEGAALAGVVYPALFGSGHAPAVKGVKDAETGTVARGA